MQKTEEKTTYRRIHVLMSINGTYYGIQTIHITIILTLRIFAHACTFVLHVDSDECRHSVSFAAGVTGF